MKSLQGQHLPLNLQCANLLPPGLNNIDALPPPNKIHFPLSPLLPALSRAFDSPSARHIPSLEPSPPAIVPLNKFRCRRVRVAPVLLEDRGPAQLDLAFALLAIFTNFLPRVDDFIRFGIDKARLDGREGPADAAVDAISVGEATAECHTDFGHAIALEEDVAAAEGCPGGFCRGGEGGGAGDVDAEVGGGDGGFGGGLGGLGEGVVGGEKAVVDCGDDGEEGYFLFGVGLMVGWW